MAYFLRYLRWQDNLSAFFLLVTTLLSLPALAQTQQRAVLHLTVNLADRGDVIVVLRSPDVLVRVSDLSSAGLLHFAGRQEALASESYVSLASLAPGITYILDEKELVLKLTADPSLFGTAVVNLRNARPEGLVYVKNRSTFFNYALSKQSGAPLSAFGEAGVNFGGPLLFSSFARSVNGFSRGVSSFIYDDQRHLRRWIIGDGDPVAYPLGAGVSVLGISLSRNFSLDPYYFPYPSFGVSTMVATPSMAEIYVNGLLVSQQPVAPGPLDLRNLPVSQGRGSVRVVIRDAFGREQEVVAPYYFASRVLARGNAEYSYDLGLVQKLSGTSSPAYGPLAFIANHRRGFTDGLTAGFALQVSKDVFNAGPTVAVRLPFGEIELEALGSDVQSRAGASASLSYRYVGRPASFGLQFKARTPHFSTLGITSATGLPLREANAFVSLPVYRRATLSLQCSAAELPRQRWDHGLIVLNSTRLTSRSNLIVSGTLARSREGNSHGFSIALSYFLGKATSVEAGFQQQGNQAGARFAVTKSPPVFGTGFGYRIQSSSGDADPVSALVQYQGQYGRYEAGYDRAGGKNTLSVTTSGGVVVIGGDFIATRSVEQSFGLIRVPGVEGVSAYTENQVVGKTNSKGDLAVPSLLPYYGNRLSIDPEGIPLNYKIVATDKVVAPPFRGGAVVLFPVHRLQSVSGVLLVETASGTVIPAYGELSVTEDGTEVASPVSKEGQFYLEDLAVGAHQAKLQYQGGDCEFQLTVTPSRQPFVNVGTIRCTLHNK